jgi:hypothetical protein
MLPQKFQIEKNSTVGDSSDRESDSLHVADLPSSFFLRLRFSFFPDVNFSQKILLINSLKAIVSIGSILEHT